MSSSAVAFALGLHRSRGDRTLDVLFPHIAYKQHAELLNQWFEELGLEASSENSCYVIEPAQLRTLAQCSQNSPFAAFTQQLAQTDIQQPPYGQMKPVLYVLYEADEAVQTPEEAYFKLQLLSQRHVQPHDVNLNGAFGVLNNIAWTNLGPILPEDLDEMRVQALLTGQVLQVSHVDKFPYLLNYHVPSGVRVASGAQVRLGAHLGEGTTVMPAGSVNFNAGTAGNAMVEGRVSAGVFVGKNTDIGGGASIMGTLSGGNKHVISIGEECLLGANGGIGISLGFGCTVAAGLYIYAGMKISMYNAEGQPVNLEGQKVEEGQNIVKARELSGRDKLLFIQDSVSGRVICKPNPRTIELNPDLHTHN